MPSPLKVLIAEDNPADAELLVRELRRAGFEPDWQRVDTAAEFWERLHADLDLVLSDYQMPQFTGLRALELLGRSGLDVPLIIVSGTIGEETAVAAMKLGAADYLLKDRLARLGLAVKQALESSRLRAERRRTTEQLRLQSTALATAANAIVITDPKGVMLWCNPAFTALSGYTAAEAAGHTPRLLKSGKHTAAFYRELWRTILTGRTWRGELINRRKDGTFYYGDQTITPVRDEAGAITHFVGVMNDVTERKLEESARKLSEFSVDHASAATFWVAPDARILRVNRAACEGLGYTEAELLTLSIPDLDPDMPREQWAGHWQELRARQRMTLETRQRRKDGRIFPVEVNLHWFEFEGQEYNFAFVRDITESKRAEAELRVSEARFRELAETISEVFWVTDPNKNQMLYISPGYEKIWGRTCQSLYDAPDTWAQSIRPEDRARVLEAVATKQKQGTYDEEYRITRPDGSERWIRDRAFPVRGADGSVQRLVGAAEDITESKKLHEQFLRAQRMEAIGTLAGGVAHDLNNILAPIVMGAGLLKERITVPRDQELINMIEGAASRGTSVIRQLLTFSRGIAGERVTLQLRHLLTEMAGIIRETFPRDIRLEETTSRDLRAVVGDPTQLHQVIMNLCVNARDAMPDGGKLVLAARNVKLAEAEVAAHAPAKPGAYVAVTVSDTGRGIPPEIVDRIFEPFFTTKPPTKGTGLGLSTVLGIVRSHGGFITVASTGGGTTFTIFLPAALDAAGVAVAPGPDALPDGNGELILVVDDEEPIRRTVRTMLEARGYRVLTASHGAEAVAMFLEERDAVRLVVTDLMMPVMNGVNLVRALRAIAPEVKVLAMSGVTDRANHEELSAAGVDGIVLKPCGPREILEAIRQQLAPPD